MVNLPYPKQQKKVLKKKAKDKMFFAQVCGSIKSAQEFVKMNKIKDCLIIVQWVEHEK